MKNDSNQPEVTVVSGFLSGKGGTETVLKTIGNDNSLSNYFDMSLFLFNKVGDPNFKNKVGYSCVDSTNLSSKVTCTLRYFKFLLNFKGDMLVITNQTMIEIAWYVRKYFHKTYKIVSWMHFAIVEGSAQAKIDKIKKADFHLAISNGIKDELIKNGVPASNIRVIFNPVKRKAKTIKPNKKNCHFIYMGRIFLHQQKNLEGIFQALDQVGGNWTLDIYGDGPDLEQAKKIVKNNTKIADNIDFHGFVRDPWSKIKEANCLLLNSNFEGLPMVLAEALSYGVPVISSNCPTGPNDIVKNGVNGYLYEVGDGNELVKDLTEFVDNEFKTDSDKIKNSVAFLYTPEYMKRFVRALQDFQSIPIAEGNKND